MNRPRYKIALKPKSGSARALDFIAIWDSNGRLNGSLDRRVEEVAIKLVGGEVVRIRKDEAGKLDHWVNFYDNASPPTAASRPETKAAFETSPPDAKGGWDFGGTDEDLPF